MQIVYKEPHGGRLSIKEVSSEESKQHLNIITVPKTGTHLLINIMHEFGIRFKFPDGVPHLSTGGSKISNVSHLKSDEKYISTIRDPRDFLISYIQWIDQEKDRRTRFGYRHIDMDTKLDWAINETTPPHFQHFTRFPKLIQALYDFDALTKAPPPPNLLLLSFEDLIGPELGGNSSEAQLNCLRKILDFTGTVASDEKIKEVAKSMIGGSFTYTTKKKVGRWKDYFKEHHVRNFKLKHNALLVSLGYEKDENWNLDSEPASPS